MKLDLASLINFIRPVLQLTGGGAAAQKQVERWLTPPKAVRDKLYAGMSADDKEEAEALLQIATDAASDYVVYVGSRGTVDAD